MDLASGRVRRGGSDAGERKCVVIHPRRMAIHARQIDRMIRRRLFQIFGRRKLAAPVRLVPVAAANPLALGTRGRGLADHLGDLSHALHVPEIKRPEHIAQGAHVSVRIDHTGNDRRAARVDAARRRPDVHLDIVAGSHHFAVFDGQRRHHRLRRVQRIDTRVFYHKIGHRGPPHRRKQD